MTRTPRRGRGVASAAACAALAVLCFSSAPALRASNEVRALWVVRTTLTSPAAVDAMVKTARASGFNTLLVQVRGRGDSYFAGGIDPRPVALVDASFDPLALTIARAHESGLGVHAWINVNLASSASELPESREHVIYRHPEWLMVPRALGQPLARMDPRSPEYLGRLSRYVRGQSATLEGLYVSPMSAAAIDYTTGVVRDIVQRYDIDGVHLDYVRYPGEDFDYSRDALTAFRRSVLPDLSSTARVTLDAELDRDALIYTKTFPERWHTFRAAQLTRLVEQLRDTVKRAKPSVLLSAAVGPDSVEAGSRFMQDWRDWIRRDLLDIVCPMAYTTDAKLFASQIAADYAIAGPHAVWAGIGAYRLSPAEIADNVTAARGVGVSGIILFSYDSLTTPARGPEFLSQVGRTLFVQ
jgi:uncharacterized lipoprotein YddW (UPF0748 family)